MSLEDSIQMKIAKTAASKYEQEQPTNLEEALSITGNSEVAAVRGIIKALGLEKDLEERLIGTKDDEGKLLRNGEIYTSASISEDIAAKIQEKLKGDNKNQTILNILSTIHDAWVKNNPNNFMKVNDDGKRRNKERQFVPLELLDFEEVKNDLLFLQPILEGAGIKIEQDQLNKEFDIKQKEYMIKNQIFSHQELINYLSKGYESYPALEGLETKFGGNINELLKNPTIQEEMANQIKSRVQVISKDQLKEKIMNSDNYVLDKILGQYKQDSGSYYVVTIRDELLGDIKGEEIPHNLEKVSPPGTYEGEMARDQVERRNRLSKTTKDEITKADITAIAKKQKVSRFNEFVQKIKEIFGKNKNNEQDKSR